MPGDPDMKFALRYVTARRNKDGSSRWYWQRKGHKAKRLPSSLVERVARAYALNVAADGGLIVPDGSVSWAIAKYRIGDRYGKLKPASLTVYNRWLREFEALWGGLHVSALTRRVCIDFRDTVKAGSTRAHAMAVLYNVLETAREYGMVEVNNAARPGVEGAPARDVVWSQSQINAVLTASQDEPDFWLAFNLLLYTGQRRGDVCAMAWTQYTGETISLRQEKTGQFVAVPCHADLRAILDAWPRLAVVMCANADGRALNKHAFTARMASYRQRLDLGDVQLRDLRRTAAVWLAEAGCTNREISSITGHRATTVQHMMDRYTPVNLEIARAAIRKLEQHQRRTRV